MTRRADRARPDTLRRLRPLAVLTILVAGGVTLLTSTQTWLIASVAEADLAVTGSSAVPVLQPLSLAALAAGLVLALVGRVLRYVLGALAILIAAAVLASVGPQLATWADPQLGDQLIGAVAPTVTDHTGITGDEAVADLVHGVSTTAWPAVAAVANVVLAAAGVLVLATAHVWPRGGRRYDRAETPHARAGTATGRLDAIDSWDELSRGDDPTDAGDSTDAGDGTDPPTGPIAPDRRPGSAAGDR